MSKSGDASDKMIGFAYQIFGGIRIILMGLEELKKIGIDSLPVKFTQEGDHEDFNLFLENATVIPIQFKHTFGNFAPSNIEEIFIQRVLSREFTTYLICNKFSDYFQCHPINTFRIKKERLKVEFNY